MRRKITTTAGILAFILFIYVTTKSIDPVALEKWVAGAGILGPLALVVLTILTGVIAPISGSPVNFAGFILYGPSVVFLFAISAIISSVINFWIAKKWGRPFVTKLVGKENTSTVDRFTKEHGLVSLFFLRIFLGGMHDFLSYAMGLTSMKFWPYFIVSVLGIIPGTLIWYAVAKIAGDPFGFLVGTYIFSGVFAGVYVLYKFVMNASKQART